MHRDEQHSLLTKNIKYYINRTLKYLNLFQNGLYRRHLSESCADLSARLFTNALSLQPNCVSERRGFYISCRLPVY